MADDAPDFASIPPADGYDTLGEYAAEVARLAALPPHEYDRVRRSEAQRLGVRVGTLDKAVESTRPREAAGQGQGEPITFEDPDPWPDLVNGATLLDAIAAFLTDRLALRPHDGTKVALWVLHTYAFEAGFISPRLAITSATKRCGKSTLIDILSVLCSRAITADSLTVAVTFRAVAVAKPSLLIDEADTFLKDNEELRGILNSGHKATGSVIRAVEVQGEWVPRKFSTFCPCAIAMIGRLPGTLEDRAIPVQMKRALRGEVRHSFRPDRRDEVGRLCSQAVRFVVDHMPALAAAEPELPPGAFNRFADNWRPLVGLADLAGGRWPELARAALLADLGAVDDDELSQQLLEDIRTIFDVAMADKAGRPADCLPSASIVTSLTNMAERPWNELGKSERPITERKLAALLKPFGIKSDDRRFPPILPGGPERVLKSYARSDFVEAWNRYNTRTDAVPSATALQSRETATSSNFPSATKGPVVADTKSRKAADSAICSPVADAKRSGRGNGMICAHCRELIRPLDTSGWIAVSVGEYVHNRCLPSHAAPRATESGAARGGNGAAAFEPTDAWQDVPDGAICPPGLHYQIDPNTGLRQARKPQAPDDLICAAPDCGATFQRPPGRGRPPKFCPAHRRPRA